MAKAKTKTVKPVEAAAVEDNRFIKPLIQVNGEKHLLENLMDQDDMPIMKSVGYMKVLKDKQHSWMSYVITTKGKEVISIEASEPDMREIAEETAKISFVNCFIDQELF